ncbi:MAG: chemotaxis response regulator protein-glutamate methylesterase [Candidatus Atribacteria bacterium]|nr:chemotaxis response regulator protein-glutamate methylesterase [Candidatus Atribacteria bacterium]
MKKIRVMLVDDSSFMRKMVGDILESDPEIEVVAKCGDGVEALEKLQSVTPDVILLDVEMPRMNGLRFLEEALQRRPERVVMLSALTQVGSETTVLALEKGALDFISKPSGSISLDIERKKDEILQKVKSASQVSLERLKRYIAGNKAAKKSIAKKEERRECERLILVASSTGGPKALQTLVRNLSPLKNSGMIFVQHMPSGFTKSLAERLSEMASLPIKEAEEGERLVVNKGIMAPGGKHLLMDRDKKVVLSDDPPVKGLKPCADVSLFSAVKIFGKNILVVVLTGMGKDAMEGCRLVRQEGGMVIAQDEASSLIFGMPRAVIEEGLANLVLPLEEIGEAIVEWDTNQHFAERER